MIVMLYIATKTLEINYRMLRRENERDRRMTMPRYMNLPLNVNTGCQACENTGVTGERYQTPVGNPPGEIFLVLDVVCPVCNAGRTNMDPGSTRGGRRDPRAGEDCPSCYGFGWYPVQGWAVGKPDSEAQYLASPCGCMEKHMVEVASG